MHRANSVKGFRKWLRMGLRGRMKRIRQKDTGLRYKAARRIRRWAKGATGQDLIR